MESVYRKTYRWLKVMDVDFLQPKMLVSEPTKLVEYFTENAEYYEEFLVQRLTERVQKIR